MTLLTRANVRYLRDAAERVAWTAIQAGAGAAIDIGTSGELSWRALGYAVGLAVAKVLVARFVGDRKSAALLP